MLTPFLFELRTVIDWMFTNTSLLFTEWVRVESIYAQVYQIKCVRQGNKFEYSRGKKLPRSKKFCIGGCLTLFLLSILWFPLILFAIMPSLGSSIIPETVEVTLQIGNFEPLFKVEATKPNIHQFKGGVWKSLLSMYEKNLSASIFLKEYEAKDVVAVNLNIDSSSSWNVPKINVDNMIKDLENGNLKSAQLTYKIYRPTFQSEVRETIHHSTEVVMDRTTCRDLAAILKGAGGEVKLIHIFPKLVKVQNNGKFERVPQMFSTASDCKTCAFIYPIYLLNFFVFRFWANQSKLDS